MLIALKTLSLVLGLPKRKNTAQLSIYDEAEELSPLQVSTIIFYLPFSIVTSTRVSLAVGIPEFVMPSLTAINLLTPFVVL